jgi:hypothetical protein
MQKEGLEYPQIESPVHLFNRDSEHHQMRKQR